MNPLKRLLQPFKDWRIARLPSRIFLRETVLPAIAAGERRRMLFVGTRSYNRPAYDKCSALGIEVWSIDLDPTASVHGAPGGHFVGSIGEVDKFAADISFDVIVFNGVLGWGVNTPADALQALEAIRRVSTSHALLFIGWNPGRTDGSEVTALRAHLTPTSLGAIPKEIEFPPKGAAQRYPHRYELFALR